jgi:hypothetical protein
MTRVLLTSFEPFGGQALNSSLEVGRALARQPLPGVELEWLTLPVVARVCVDRRFSQSPQLTSSPPKWFDRFVRFPRFRGGWRQSAWGGRKQVTGWCVALSVALMADGSFRPMAVLPPVFGSCSLAVGFLAVAETAVTTGVTRAQLVSATPNCHGTFPGTLRDV